VVRHFLNGQALAGGSLHPGAGLAVCGLRISEHKSNVLTVDLEVHAVDQEPQVAGFSFNRQEILNGSSKEERTKVLA
jgi:hypothetical protein